MRSLSAFFQIFAPKELETRYRSQSFDPLPSPSTSPNRYCAISRLTFVGLKVDITSLKFDIEAVLPSDRWILSDCPLLDAPDGRSKSIGVDDIPAVPRSPLAAAQDVLLKRQAERAGTGSKPIISCLLRICAAGFA